MRAQNTALRCWARNCTHAHANGKDAADAGEFGDGNDADADADDDDDDDGSEWPVVGIHVCNASTLASESRISTVCLRCAQRKLMRHHEHHSRGEVPVL